MTEPLTFLDFFSGVGGFRKGFELCGMVCKGHCEIDKFADRSYRAIHDIQEDEWYGEDITKTEPADLPRANLWAGGFPCQDISVSGRQRGLAGKRSSLFFEIIRLLKGTPAEDRPEWLVLENVKNLLSVNRGWDFATVLCSLAEIGYHIEYGLLNSRFHGVPQNRERIYLVAYRHFRAGGGRKIFPVTAGDGKALIQLIGGTQGKRVYDPAGISCTLMSEGGGFGGRTGMYFIDLCKGNPKLTENARCIKARYDSGIGNRSADNSGVLCMGADCPDRTDETALIQLKRNDPKIREQDYTKCLIAGYNKIGVSNRGESSGVFYGCRAVLTPDRENKRQNGRRFKECGEPAFCLNTQDKHGVYLCACDSCEHALPVIIAFGTFVSLTVGSSRLQDWLGIQSMLSAYASDIVDTKGAIAVDKESMLADNHIIDLENRDGSNTVYLFSEPISYTDENGNLKAKDISVEKQSDKELKSNGYEYTNGQNDYRINFSKDSNKGLYIEFGNSSYSIIPQSDKAVVGNESTSQILNEKFEDFEYPNIYGQGTNLKFYPQLNGVKDEIVLDSNIGQNVFSFKLTTSNCTAVLNEDGTVSLVSSDDEESVQIFSAPYAYDSEYVEGDRNEHYIDCSYTLDKIDDSTYIMSVNVDKAWLDSENTVYPVVIDPTTSNITMSADAGVYSKYASNNYGSEQTGCFGRASDYGYGSVYTKFTVPTAIKKGAKINSAYQWMRETTGRTTTTYVTPYMVTSSWSETGITWSNKASYNTGVAGTKKNINSKSTDDPDNSYWYKFNIAGAVKKWVDGTANYGVAYVSSDANSSGTYNWRAFTSRTYSSSAMRPYTVINYTNDATAPTVTSVTGNPTAWTKNNVTLTVNGAKDNSGGSGLHATPYSFSTTKDSYSWQKENKKTFSSNCTVYVYVRDALGNIRLASTQTINKIDKTAPTATNVTGNSTAWTNKNITLTVNGAKDSQSGLHSSAYSFSTSQGAYNWQAGNSKTFSSNSIIYVYIRDAVENTPKLISTVNIDKIDKNKPTKPTVTGNTDNWTNGDVELTAQSSDDESGIAAYSFSTEVGKYDWQTENTYTESQESKLYVYSKDNTGNISEPAEIDLKIDKLSPSGIVNAENPTDWVKQVVITADASDEISGLNEKPYSFSTKEGEYSWQSENTKTVTSNGTYYIYTRDYAENITLLDTVTIDKIDNASPTINNVNITDSGNNKTIITVEAQDNQSGLAQYSIDNGETWQSSNIFEIEKDSLNYIAVKTKDNLGNITYSAKYYDIYTPQIYYENGKIGIYNPNPNCECDIYYKLNRFGSFEWIKYEKPFTVDQSQKIIYLSFYPRFGWVVPEETPVEIEYGNPFAYCESNMDLSLAYNGVSFNIDRQYRDNQWSYSTESKLNIKTNSFIEAELPDFNSLSFVKQNKYLYINEVTGCKLAAIYDENDENIVEYILRYNNINYHYDLNGRLTKISNSSCDLFNFTYTENNIIIEDGAGRTTTISYTDNHISSITDADGGIVNYFYNDNTLVKVTDQAGVIIGEYEYDENVLVKSGHNNIIRDVDNRVAGILADNGFSTRYEYSDNKVTISSSDEKCAVYTYDFRGNILTYTDDSGEITSYTYDAENRIEKVTVGDKTSEEFTYDESSRVASKTNETGVLSYSYNDNGDIIRAYDNKYSDKDSTVATYYVYNEYGNVTLQAQLDGNATEFFPDAYDPGLEYKSIVRYEYHNGLPVKVTDSDDNVTISIYDEYGNVTKSTASVTENGKTTISVSESEYDILNRLTLSKSDNSEISYIYDAAGRVLLTNADNNYQRIVYDNYGRTIQEIDNSAYNPELDNLPDAYTDIDAGQRYIYDGDGNLIKEISSIGIETNYTYSNAGTLRKKSFDIYDYYYHNNGSCDKIDVNGRTIVDYDYKVTNSNILVGYDGYVNRITYADGYIEEHEFNKSGNVLAKYAGASKFYSVQSASSKRLSYYENETASTSIITSGEDSYTYCKQKGNKQEVFSLSVTTADEAQTISEKHFGGKEYTTIAGESAVSYSSPAGAFAYRLDGDENSSSQIISRDSADIISSRIAYDDTSNVLSKSYDTIGLEFEIVYDDDGNIISDGDNEYTYNELGELESTSGKVNASYTYDSRGNMLSKTVDGTETVFSYNNEQWKDQLTSVNNVDLTYDANGNLVSYGDTTYSWSHGRWLDTVTNGENSYLYKYDANGIRASKRVNGVITNFDTLNGKILAQYDTEYSNCIYFQYYNDAPIGFILNDVQYFYITNLNGDITGITDADGSIIAEYTYDDWGKLLGIETAEENNAEQLSVAEMNPLRYRGYYYDSETGMYYLQSRYYNPEICRFISADDFSCLNTLGMLNVNAYIYCWNCPVAFHDVQGTTPKLSINLTDIVSFIQNINNRIKDGITAGINKLTEKWNNLVDKWKISLKTHYNSFIDKLEYFINYPDAVINDTLSEIFNKDVNIRFRLIELIREKTNFRIDLSGLKVDVDEDESGITPYYIVNDDEKTDNWLLAVIKALAIAIPVHSIVSEFEAIVQTYNRNFDFNKWYKSLSDGLQNTLIDIGVYFSTLIHTAWKEGKEYVEEYFTMFSFDKIVEWLIDSEGFSFNISNLISFTSAFNDRDAGKYTNSQAWISFILNVTLTAVSVFVPMKISGRVGMDLLSFISNFLLDGTFNFQNGHLWGY